MEEQSAVKKELEPDKIAIYASKQVLAEAIEEGVDKGLEDIFSHIKKQTKIVTFGILGILAMLAVIAVVIGSFHNVPALVRLLKF